jgi:hypothetical protein
MNLKLITTYTLSVCTIAQAAAQTSVQASTVETALSPEKITVSRQSAAIVTQLENATIRTIAQPESFSTQPQVAAQVAAQVGAEVNPTATPTATYGSQTPRIEVGTQGIPAVTDLPDRVALPQAPLYPVNFENPIILGQTIDRSITTNVPITDKMADPTWSRKMEDLAAYKTAYSQNLVAWSDRVSQCMTEKPKLYVMRSDGKQLPIYFDGKEGSILLNKEGVSVCAI